MVLSYKHAKAVEWVGVDLDGTLAEYAEWKGKEHIGAPIEKMLSRVKEWLANGKTVKLFTARASDPEALPFIAKWLERHGLKDLEITNQKDQSMVELWDDRAVTVEKNTGKVLSKRISQLDLPPAVIQQVPINAVEQQIVAACLIGEAGGEGTTGMQAVMNVIQNRAGGNPAKFAAVCLKPYQFSMFNSATVAKKVKLGSIIEKAKQHTRWNEAMDLVKKAAAKKLPDVTEGSTHYHTMQVKPKWAPSLKPTVQLGNHKFYL